jgi:hypothetical protein
MPVFESKADFEERRANGGDYATLKEGEYVFRIKDILTADWGPNQYRDTGDVILLDLEVVENADDPEEPVLGTDDKPFDPNTWVRFPINGTFDKPQGFGFGPAGAGKARRAVASALGINVNDKLVLEDEQDWRDKLIGGYFIGQVIPNNGFPKFEGVRAYKRKKSDRADRPKPQADMITAAQEVFKDDVDKDDLPF